MPHLLVLASALLSLLHLLDSKASKLQHKRKCIRRKIPVLPDSSLVQAEKEAPHPSLLIDAVPILDACLDFISTTYFCEKHKAFHPRPDIHRSHGLHLDLSSAPIVPEVLQLRKPILAWLSG